MENTRRRPLHPSFNRLLMGAGILCLFQWGMVVGQDALEAPPAASTTVKELTARIDRIKAAEPPTDSPQAQLLGLYGKALDKLALTDEWRQKASRSQKQIDEAPEQISRIEQALANPPEEIKMELAEGATLIEAGQQQDEYRTALDRAREDLMGLVEESTRRTERRRKLPALITAAKMRLTDLGAASDISSAKDALPEITEARRTLHQLNRLALQAEIRAAELELASYDARGRLLTHRIDRAGRITAQEEKRVAAFQKLVEERSLKEELLALRLALEVREKVDQVNPLVRDKAQSVADDIDRIATLLSGKEGLLSRMQSAQKKLDEVKKQTQRLENSFADIQKRAKATGRNSAVGRLLRRQMSGLPDVGELKRGAHARRNELAELELTRFEMEDERRAVGDIEVLLTQQLADLQDKASERETYRTKELMREILQKKKKALGSVSQYYDDYTDALFSLDLATKKLLIQTETVSRFIDEQVLWIRSSRPLWLDTLHAALAPVAWLLTPSNWLAIVDATWQELRRSPIANGMMVFLVIVLAGLRLKLTKLLSRFGEEAMKPRMTELRPTIHALIVTVLMASLWPVTLWIVWWHLEGNAFAGNFAQDVGFASLITAATLISLELLWHVARKNGLAQAHFRWPKEALQSIRRHFVWFGPITLASVFAIAMLYHHGDEAWVESLGRLLFIAQMVSLLIFSALLFPRKSGVMESVTTLKRAPGKHVFFRTTRLVALAAPVALIVVDVMGYGYTAMHLGWRLYLSGCLLFVLVIGAELVSRALLLARRRIAIEQAHKKLEALKQEGKTASEAEIQDELIDLTTVSTQSERLLRSSLVVLLVFGLWFIWADVIPALGVLDEVQIGQTTTNITHAEDGTELAAPRQATVPISLKDLAVALLITFITIGAIRNLPGLLEMTLLTRMGLPAGERNAITTIIRYGITIFGVVYACDALGVDWSKAQWLVAAMGVGLGFGLQEIFANFISGLMILFERPVRVGDVVTIGDISGTVTRIRIRATTITDFDRKDLIVPNKEFVTGRLINWTRTDSVLRVIVPVGIAYGSDTDEAIKLLHRVAADAPLAIKIPQHQVYFRAFGASSLDLELWAYCDSADNRIPLIHDLHLRIDRAFREAEIEIAFPQQDIHVRSIEEALPISEDARSDLSRLKPVDGTLGAFDLAKKGTRYED